MNAYLKYLILFIFLGAVVPGKAQEYGRGSKAKATAATTTTTHTKALVIGTSAAAARDAILFSGYLEHVAQVPVEQLITLSGKTAKAAQIYTALKKLTDSIQEGDQVYFYFSGTSVYSDFLGTPESLLLAADFKAEEPLLSSTGIVRLSDILNLLGKASAEGASIQCILDTNKADDPLVFQQTAKRNMQTIQTRTQNYTCFLATGPEGTSYNSASNSLGVFTHNLVLGLMGAADTNADDRITYSELDDYLYTQVQQQTGKQQQPVCPSLPGESVRVLPPGARAQALKLAQQENAKALFKTLVH